jgi:preprotein translocase subunit SecF
MELFRNANYNFLKWKWIFIAFSLFLSLAGMISLVVKGGPRYGIDFRGGTLVYLRFQQQPPLEQLRQALKTRGMGDSTIQQYGVASDHEVVIGLEQKSQNEESIDAGKQLILDTLRQTFAGDQGQKLDLNNAGRDGLANLFMAKAAMGEQQANDLTGAMVARRTQQSGLLNGMADLRGLPGLTPQAEQVLASDAYFAPYALRNTEVVGPKVGGDLRRQALYATLYALTGMLVYIAFRFEWVYGVGAIVATLHDAIITIGFFSLFNKEISLTVVAALLTLVGYSTNDTIVVFDRIRENLKLMRRESLRNIVNRSINQTLSRTILTSGLTFLTVMSLFLWGGEVLHGFAFALVVGIVIGTYSSIAIASPIVVVWQQWYDARKNRGRVITLDKDRAPKPKVGARVKA